MVVLLWFDLLGFLASLFAYVSIFLCLDFPSNAAAIILNICMVLSTGVRLLLTYDIRQGDEWFFGKSLKGLCPIWLKISAGITIIYGVANGIICFVRVFLMISPDIDDFGHKIAMRLLFMAVFSLIMGCYAMEFLHVYLYKSRRKINTEKLQGDGLVW
ncbi:MAG: hypothetical protein LLF92_09945 [Planctomycetaceae bacterium]|nr:hypothetical protein [Planctomycetaceae bacterium]